MSGKNAVNAPGQAKDSGFKKACFAFLRILPNLILFELIYKLVTAVVFSPLLSWVIKAAQAAGGHGVAFNERMLGFFFSPLGILSSLVFAALGAVITYYEFSVLVLTAHACCRGLPVGVSAAMKRAFRSLKSLLNTGAVGYAVYALALLPYTGSGIRSSLLPEVSLPHFITGELAKTTRGGVLLFVGNAVLLVLAVLLVFAVPRMVLAGKGFWRAAGGSVGLFRKMGVKTALAVALGALGLGVAGAAVHGGGEYMLAYARTVMVNDLSPGVLYLPQASAAVVAFLLLWVLGMLLTPFIFTLLVHVYLRFGGEVAPDIVSGAAQPGAPGKKHTGMRAFFRRHTRAWMSIACVLPVLLMGVVMLGYTLRDMREGDKLIFGHRGCNYAVENTLEAIGKAAEAGADFAEIDVLLSKDNIPMVIHDANLNRLAGQNVSVGDLSAEELQRLTLRQNGMEGKISTS